MNRNAICRSDANQQYQKRRKCLIFSGWIKCLVCTNSVYPTFHQVPLLSHALCSGLCLILHVLSEFGWNLNRILMEWNKIRFVVITWKLGWNEQQLSWIVIFGSFIVIGLVLGTYAIIWFTRSINRYLSVNLMQISNIRKGKNVFFLPGLIKCPVCTNSHALKHVSLGDFICNIWVWIEFWSSGARLDFMFWLQIRLGFYLSVWVELWYEHLSSGNCQFGIVFNDWVWWICLSVDLNILLV